MGTWIEQQDAAAVERACSRLRETAEGLRALAEASGDEQFALWLALVDRRLMNALGVGHNDLADWRWRSAYDEGCSPGEAAREALVQEGWVR